MNTQSVSINMEVSVPVNLGNLEDGVLLKNSINYLAPALLGLLVVARSLGPKPPGNSTTEYGRSAGPLEVDDVSVVGVLHELGVTDTACQARVTCEVHRMVATIPAPLLPYYTHISSSLDGWRPYEFAAVHGLGGGDCSQVSGQCSSTLTQMLHRSGVLKMKSP